MKVDFVNTNEPIKLHHTCNVCNINFAWNEESGYYEKCIGSGYAAYEVTFKICSEECRQKAIKYKMIENFYNNNPQ